MKKFTLIILFVIAFISIHAQSNKVDKRLLSKYSIEELTTMQSENPDQYKLLSFCLDHAWYLQDLPKDKVKANPNRVGSIKIKDINNINFYELNIEFVQDDYQFFAIEGTDKMFVVKSMNHILKEINK